MNKKLKNKTSFLKNKLVMEAIKLTTIISLNHILPESNSSLVDFIRYKPIGTPSKRTKIPMASSKIPDMIGSIFSD